MDKQQEQLEALTAQLEQGVRELYSSERYAQYLRAMSKFYQYSSNNVLLINMQCPDATAVASYTTWKNDFGRYINRGEHGIRILCPVRRYRDMEKQDPLTHQPVLDTDGKPILERKEVIFFRVGYVYDISQTSGKELPRIARPLEGTVKKYSLILEALREVAPVPIGFEAIPGATNGYYHTAEHRIAIRQGMSQSQTVKTAIHEITHSLLDAEAVRAASRLDGRTRE
ncbi:MAG: ssDNA-binding domain-containing protein, partial [Oscillospiraceae bacterium]|nr:ssDNA-binding domain-containing protein [Oscillospiraceae bacterium]